MPTQQNSSTQSKLSSSVWTKTNTQTSEQNRYLYDHFSIPSPPPPPNIGPVMVYSPLDLSRKSDPRTTVEAKADLPASTTVNHSIAKLVSVEEIQQEQTKSKAKLSIELQSPNKTNNTSAKTVVNKKTELDSDNDNTDDLENILQELFSENEKIDGEMVISSEMLSKRQSNQHNPNETLPSDNSNTSKKRAARGFMDGNSKMLSQQKDKHQEVHSVNTADMNKERLDIGSGTSSKQAAMQHESKSVAKNNSQTEIDVQSAKKAKTINITSEKCVGKCSKLISPPQQEPIVNIPTKKISVAQQTEPNIDIRNFDQLAMAMNDIKTQLIKNQQLVLYEVRMLSEKIKYSDSILGQHQSHTTNQTHLSDKGEVQKIRLKLVQSKLKRYEIDSSSIPTMALKDDSSSTAASNLPPTTSTTSAPLKDLQDEHVETVSVSSKGQDNPLNSKPSDTKNIKPKTVNEYFMGVYWSKQNKHFFIMLRQSKGWKTARSTEQAKGNNLIFAWIGLKKRVCISGYITKYHSKTIEWNARSKTAKILGNNDHKSNAKFLIKIIGSILKKKKVSFKHTHISDTLID